MSEPRVGRRHRYKYGWKHDVDPDRAPPYYNREITDNVGSLHASHAHRGS